MPDTTSALGGVGLLHHRSAASGKISSGSKFETSPLKPTSSSSLINRSARNGSVKGGGAKTQVRVGWMKACRFAGENARSLLRFGFGSGHLGLVRTALMI